MLLFSLSALAAVTVVLGTVIYMVAASRTGSEKSADLRSVFLFEGDELIDASPSAEHLLAEAPPADGDWNRTVAALGPRFPRLGSALGRIEDLGSLSLRSYDGTSQLTAEVIDGRIRMTVTEISPDSAEVKLDPGIFRTVLRELDVLRSVSSRIPFPVWRQTPEGEITWANRAFLDLGRQVTGHNDVKPWPPKPVFPEESIAELTRELGSRRLTVRDLRSGEDSWFECRSTEIDDEVLFTAVNIDGTVTAEKQLREFMQTLTKTFSHLTTGLAVFDRHRRLALFNPALTDLTGLPVDFLAARPTLYTVLDRLRDRGMLPEPKDYGSWRRQIAELEAAAVDGTYSETWSLPENRTYQVTGRPHPGGALAFLIEDISAEMSLTRRFRSELELGQAVIDALDDAIIVFAPNGTLSMVNKSYQALWSTDVGDTIDLPSVTEISRMWMARSEATPVWGEVRDFVLHASERTSWQEEVTLTNGARLQCQILPLTGRSTMVRFAEVAGETANAPDLQAAG
ncbi:MAG: PAS-domain containing protein [Pseudomonadota bacterium]